MGRRRLPARNPRLVVAEVGGPSALAEAANAYLADIEAKGFSPYTVAYRAKTLAYLCSWLAERGVAHPAEVTKPMLERYQRHLFHHRKPDGTPLSFRTRVTYLVPVKGLFRWLAQTNRILYNPASELCLPRAEHRLPRLVLGVAEVEAVLGAPDVAEPLGLRDRALMEVLYSTAVRRSEVIALAMGAIDVERGTMAVRQGKGRRDRFVPIGERAVAWVDRYLVEARPRLVVPPDAGVLFLSADGNDITPDHLTRLVGRYVAAATGRRGSCHTFRHTAATLMLEGGADIRYVQEMLGHALLSTTQIYTQVSIDRLKAVHTACHPGATLERRRSPVAEAGESPGDDGHDDGHERAELLSALSAEADEERDEDAAPERRRRRS
ncbi:MAG: site-specific tyrosine recombinase XerC [Acidimicrobiales bacterium]